jgi:hypothetical protein
MKLKNLFNFKVEKTEVTLEQIENKIEYEILLKRHDQWQSQFDSAKDAEEGKKATSTKAAAAIEIDPYAWKKGLPLGDQEHQNELYRRALLAEPERTEQLETAWRRGWQFVPGQLDEQGNPKPEQLPRPVRKNTAIVRID